MTYRDQSLSVPDRAAQLLELMTPEEKIGQLVQLFGWRAFHKTDKGPVLDDGFREAVARGGVGALYGTLRADPWTGVTLKEGLSSREGAEAVNMLQRFAVEHSRLGIPLLFGEECSHGHMAIGATVFPVPLSAGSTWNTGLYAQMCRAVALETRSQGGAVTYSPVLDVVRDPRWGRTEECFGEDPFLIGEFGKTAVRSMQGTDLRAPDSIGVTLKHFAAYGSSEGGRNGAPVHMGLRELLGMDLQPFRKAVQAGALSVMPAYNEIDGIPCSANRWLLTGLLRDEWGFDGFVISDCGAIGMLEQGRGHDLAEGPAQAAALALRAGVDMEMSGTAYGAYLLEALDKGEVSIGEIDGAVRRVLEAKLRLGLFENPYADPDKAAVVINSPEHRALARRMAEEGTVLLKNDGGTLPLGKNIRRLAVIGPNADRMYNQLGDYTSPQPRDKVVTVLDGIRTKLEGAGGEVLYAPGCRIRDESREGFPQAIACADHADAVVLVLGGSSARDFGEGAIDMVTGASVVTDDAASDMDCGEGIDRAELGLSGVQLELARAIIKRGKPVIVVYINGRPIVEPWVEEHADAILEAWYPGQEGGGAIAGLLFGDVNPSGKLTVTVPRHGGQVPLVYNGKRTRGKRYLETDLAPRYPFGFGLSYTTFSMGSVHVTPEVIPPDGIAQASAEVVNTGRFPGAEVVQLYISDVAGSVTRPERELKGFRKVFLEPGERVTVTFPVGPEHLELIDAGCRNTVEEGEFIIRIGSSSADNSEGRLLVKKGEPALHKRFKLPVIDMPALELPEAVKKELLRAEQALSCRPRLQRQFRNCFPNTLETTVKLMEDGTTFVITGDIPAMWLRDSVEQVFPYIPLADKDRELQRILKGLVRRHAANILIDPYANAFNESANGNHWDSRDQSDRPVSEWVWERKFELDSLCFSVRLAYHYWKGTGDVSIFDAAFREAMDTVLRVFLTEQRHNEASTYRFHRTGCRAIDTLANGGAGTPTGYTGMIWSGFRPSDDACEYHYHIPSNMMAVVALRQMREMAAEYGADAGRLAQISTVEHSVEEGIRRYGIVEHPRFGQIYAYETDGLGHWCLLDDAGTPGLLSIPYFGYAPASDPVYRNTRRFILSSGNPYYFEGTAARGIGSPHTPNAYIWPMALSMQGLTAESDGELLEMLAMLEATDANTGFMHEGFHADDPELFTRPWFAWSNSLFAQLVRKALDRGICS